MTGEMCKADVTRESFPLHFAAADQVPGATVEPFDVYQGPYIRIPGRGRFWLCSEDGVCGEWWSESYDQKSATFFYYDGEDVPAGEFVELIGELPSI